MSDTSRWRGSLCLEVNPLPNTIIIFGASGDLTGRKLLPALFSLFRRGLLHEKSRIVGCARTPMTDDAYRERLRTGWLAELRSPELERFLELVSYVHGDYGDADFYARIGRRLDEVESAAGGGGFTGRIFYLAMPPELYSAVVPQLAAAGLLTESASGLPWRHVVLEKPFGHDLDSARQLDRELHRHLTERQIYRIDHYLGKETVQNLMILRFANTIFEPVWNAGFVDSVEISIAESVGVEHRAGYFDRTGLLRDMFQNHLLELLALVAMEPPAGSDADSIRDEKLTLLRSLRPIPPDAIGRQVVRAQYTAGAVNGIAVPGYREERDVAPGSETETCVAMRLYVDNWRWRGVPFLLRSGKRLAAKSSRIIIRFKPVPHSVFAPLTAADLAPNRLVIDIQPSEGMRLELQAKEPGPKLCMGTLSLDFKYASILDDGQNMPDAYERLLLDCMLGDQTLFIRSDTILRAWELLTPILEAWQRGDPAAGELLFYPAGSPGPVAAERKLGFAP